jgi:Cdc6-like AAA superfamily ATPase
MESFNTSANDKEDGQEINTIKPHSELIIDQIPSLPLHFKLVLYACVSVIGQNKRNTKAVLTDVFIEYRRLADEMNIDWLSMNRINEIAKELEMLGFLICSYTRKREGRVRYVRFREPAQIPRYTSMLKEELGKVGFEKDSGIII